MKKIWIAFAVTLVVALPLRIYGMFSLLDLQTGFYKDGGKIAAVTAAVLLAGIAVITVMNLKKSRPSLCYRPVRNVLTAVLCALTGILVVLQSLIGFTTGAEFGNQTVCCIFSAAGVLAGLVFLITSYDFATGFRNLRKISLAALLPSLWGCLCLWALFVSYSATVNLIENVYNTFTVMLLLLFLFHQAKLLTGIESEKSGKVIFTVGFPAALVTFATSFPNNILLFSGKSLKGVFPVGLHLVNTVMALYILCFLAVESKMFLKPHQPEAAMENLETVEEETVVPEQSAKQAEPIVHRPAEQEEQPEAENLSLYSDYLKQAYGCSEKFDVPAESPFYGVQKL